MRKLAVTWITALILISCGAVYAAGGDTADPLITLHYMTATYVPDVVQQAGARIEERMQETYRAALADLDARHSAYMEGGAAPEPTGGDTVPALLDQRVKRGDVISLPSGSTVLLLAGNAVASYAAGAVVDLTQGQIAPTGSALTPNHRYLAAEGTTAMVSITSDTAVIALEGGPGLNPSGETDYNALADALKAMGMFQGTGTGYGGGYDLEKIPTRIEGLIMFLRMVGEEEDALAYSGTSGFVDVPDWCERYVAYAKDKGYTQGIGLDGAGRPCFGTDRTIGAGEYITFVLRALGYQDGGAAPDFTWDTALVRAQALGVLTAGEGAMLAEHTFTRAQVAYLSFFSLTAPMKQGGVLLDYLSASGALNGAVVQQVMGTVPVARIS